MSWIPKACHFGTLNCCTTWNPKAWHGTEKCVIGTEKRVIGTQKCVMEIKQFYQFTYQIVSMNIVNEPDPGAMHF